jgi:DNA helicase HerA-like ATPase
MDEGLAGLAAGYGFTEPAVALGRAVRGDEVDTGFEVAVPLAMLNRHGLVAGATGTGKTKTAQGLAGRLSDAGVPCFVADMKGDLSGMAEPGEASDKVAARVEQLKAPWDPHPASGKGIVTLLELADVADRPRVFSTFMMWLLAELFEALPEVGDLDRPKLVFFFDEAHLLFDGASKAFVDQVQRTVRLIRSKGVGVFFITQLPQDLPDEVLAQLGNRVQHALRAITPKDAAAIDKTVQTYPMTEVYDLASALTSWAWARRW